MPPEDLRKAVEAAQAAIVSIPGARWTESAGNRWESYGESADGLRPAGTIDLGWQEARDHWSPAAKAAHDRLEAIWASGQGDPVEVAAIAAAVPAAMAAEAEQAAAVQAASEAAARAEAEAREARRQADLADLARRRAEREAADAAQAAAWGLSAEAAEAARRAIDLCQPEYRRAEVRDAAGPLAEVANHPEAGGILAAVAGALGLDPAALAEAAAYRAADLDRERTARRAEVAAAEARRAAAVARIEALVLAGQAGAEHHPAGLQWSGPAAAEARAAWDTANRQLPDALRDIAIDAGRALRPAPRPTGFGFQRRHDGGKRRARRN